MSEIKLRRRYPDSRPEDISDAYMRGYGGGGMSEKIVADDGHEGHWYTGEEIVRCRDCKHYRDHMWVVITDVDDVCLFWHGEPTKVEPDGFCAWGERK